MESIVLMEDLLHHISRNVGVPKYSCLISPTPLFVLTPTPSLFLESLPVENVRLPGNVPLLPSIEYGRLRDHEF